MTPRWVAAPQKENCYNSPLLLLYPAIGPYYVIQLFNLFPVLEIYFLAFILATNF
jgi:hypothetical protein